MARWDAPFRATIFHAVGLKAMAPTLSQSDCFDQSTYERISREDISCGGEVEGAEERG